MTPKFPFLLIDSDANENIQMGYGIPVFDTQNSPTSPIIRCQMHWHTNWVADVKYKPMNVIVIWVLVTLSGSIGFLFAFYLTSAIETNRTIEQLNGSKKKKKPLIKRIPKPQQEKIG